MTPTPEQERVREAAPELLEALTNLTMWMRVVEGIHGEFKGGAASALSDADEAIRKARGE